MANKSVRAKFGARVSEAMMDAGHIRKRGSLIGPDLYLLAEKLQVSREMARRYLAGEGLPDPDKIAQLAEWLAVNISWLRDGVGAKHGDAPSADDIAKDDDERKLLKYFRRAKPDGRKFILRTAMVTIVTNGDE